MLLYANQGFHGEKQFFVNIFRFGATRDKQINEL